MKYSSSATYHLQSSQKPLPQSYGRVVPPAPPPAAMQPVAISEPANAINVGFEKGLVMPIYPSQEDCSRYALVYTWSTALEEAVVKFSWEGQGTGQLHCR